MTLLGSDPTTKQEAIERFQMVVYFWALCKRKGHTKALGIYGIEVALLDTVLADDFGMARLDIELLYEDAKRAASIVP